MDKRVWDDHPAAGPDVLSLSGWTLFTGGRHSTVAELLRCSTGSAASSLPTGRMVAPSLWDTRFVVVLLLNRGTSRGSGVAREHLSVLKPAPTDEVTSTPALFCSRVDGRDNGSNSASHPKLEGDLLKCSTMSLSLFLAVDS